MLAPALSIAATERTHGVPPERPVLLRLYARCEAAPGTIGEDDKVRHDYGFDAIFFIAFNFDGEGSALAINHLLGRDPEVVAYPDGDLAVLLGWDERRDHPAPLSEYVLEEVVERDMREDDLRQLHEDIEADAEPGDLM